MQTHIDGVESVLHNERLVTAAQQVFDAEVVRPLIVFANLTAPMPQNRKHTDVPTFRGVERSQYPAWVVQAMAASGLFERWRVKVATAVAWYYDGPNGGFSYWPDGGAAPEVTIEPPSNFAVVGDNDFMYHRVEAVGDGRFAMVPIDSLLSFDAESASLAHHQGRPRLRRLRSRRHPHLDLVEGRVLPRRRGGPRVRRAPRRHHLRPGARHLAGRLRRAGASSSPTSPTLCTTAPSSPPSPPPTPAPSAPPDLPSLARLRRCYASEPYVRRKLGQGGVLGRREGEVEGGDEAGGGVAHVGDRVDDAHRGGDHAVVRSRSRACRRVSSHVRSGSPSITMR